MAWTTLTLQVTTPLFNGGADPDGTLGLRHGDEAGIRVASIRGAMRFWFRALAGAATGPDLRLLAGLERRIFGSASDQGQPEAGHPARDQAEKWSAASPLLLRLPEQPPVVPATGPHAFLPDPTMDIKELRRHPSRWLLYLMGQGLADMGKCILHRAYVAPEEEFELKVGFRHSSGTTEGERAAIEVLAFAALWLTCTYGGIGARTRRGFGGIRIIEAEGPLPGPWQQAGAMLTPGLDYYEQLCRNKQPVLWLNDALASSLLSVSVLAHGRGFDLRQAWDRKPPTFPVLSRTHTRVATSGGGVFGDWAETLTHAGKEFRYFRANMINTNPRAGYQPAIETREWADVIHGDDDRFPVGALGLPVGYKDKYVVNVDRGSGSEGPLRRASPLWLRSVGGGDEWRLLSFAFYGEFLPGPDAPGVHLWHNGSQERQLQVTTDDVRRVSEQWISVLQRDGSFADGDRRE